MDMKKSFNVKRATKKLSLSKILILKNLKKNLKMSWTGNL